MSLLLAIMARSGWIKVFPMVWMLLLCLIFINKLSFSHTGVYMKSLVHMDALKKDYVVFYTAVGSHQVLYNTVQQYTMYHSTFCRFVGTTNILGWIVIVIYVLRLKFCPTFRSYVTLILCLCIRLLSPSTSQGVFEFGQA